MKIKPLQINKLINDKNFLDGIFLIFGNNSGLIEKTYHEILKNFNIDIKDPFSTSKISGLQLLDNHNCLMEEMSTYSIISKFKTIILDLKTISNFQQIIPILENCLKNHLKNNKLIIIAGNLKTKDKIVKLIEEHDQGILVPCYEEEINTTKSKLKKYLLDNNLNIQEKCFEKLSMRFSKDTQLNDNVFEKIKLISFSKDLDSNSLIDIFDDNLEADVGIMCNYLLSGKFSAAIKLLDKCFATKISSVLICRKFFTKLKQIEKLLLFLEKHENFEKALKESSLNTFFKEKKYFYEQSKLWSLSSINSLMNKIIETETKCKLFNDLDYSILENTFIYTHFQILRTLK